MRGTAVRMHKAFLLLLDLDYLVYLDRSYLESDMHAVGMYEVTCSLWE